MSTVFNRAFVNTIPSNGLVGLQPLSIGPGDNAYAELVLDESGTYPAVNHVLGHGAIALLRAG